MECLERQILNVCQALQLHPRMRESSSSIMPRPQPREKKNCKEEHNEILWEDVLL
jgi:hypothetical protein